MRTSRNPRDLWRAGCVDEAHVRFGGAARGNGPVETPVPRPGPTPTTSTSAWRSTSWPAGADRGARGRPQGTVALPTATGVDRVRRICCATPHAVACVPGPRSNGRSQASPGTLDNLGTALLYGRGYRAIGADHCVSSWPRTRARSASAASRWPTSSASDVRTDSSAARAAAPRPPRVPPRPRCGLGLSPDLVGLLLRGLDDGLHAGDEGSDDVGPVPSWGRPVGSGTRAGAGHVRRGWHGLAMGRVEAPA